MSLIKKGDRVKVDFISESRTIYSGKCFTGYGVVDRFEDGRVFGRLEDGTPFMCFEGDVEVLTGRGGAKAMRENFEKLTASSPSYLKLVFQHGERLFIFEDGQYKISAVQLAWEIFKEKQTEVDELKCELKRINLWYSNVKLQLENKEIDSAIDAKKIDELQKRVDAAQKLIDDWNCGGVNLFDLLDELEQALKGGEA